MPKSPRVVIDTNVFISALLKKHSQPAEVVKSVLNHGALLTSLETQAELLRVLQYPKLARFMDEKTTELAKRLLSLTELVEIVERVRMSRDPADDKFLDVAINGDATCIVSGDADLLVLCTVRAIPIVTVTTYLAAVNDLPH